jgi:hypothetical protein
MINILLWGRLPFGWLFLCLLFRHAAILAESNGNTIGSQLKLTHYPIFQFSFIADPGTGHAEDIALRMVEVCLAARAIMPKAESI